MNAGLASAVRPTRRLAGAQPMRLMVAWAPNVSVVVEACSDLGGQVWSPISINLLTDGSSYFSDPQWTNHPSRFYRLRTP